MTRGSIIIVEDEIENLKGLTRALEKVGYLVKGFQDPFKAIDYVQTHEATDLVITDLKMHGMNGMEVLRKIKEVDSDVGVLLVTAFGSVESAVEAMKVGADDYLAKPVDLYELRKRVDALVEKRRLSREVAELKARLDERFGFESIVGNSRPMRELFQQLRMVAPTRATVLIYGESGTGKELIANAIHQQSDRKRFRFLPINCAAIPENLIESELFGHEKGAFTGADKVHPGKFEQANGGTLFLDEIGELSLDMQAKLLRVLEERVVTRVGGTQSIPVDVRIIAATHQDLGLMVREGTFRQDLFYRLRVVELRIPALRQRLDDIPLLVPYFLKQFNQEHGKQVRSMSDGVLNVLMSQKWPGNVRELRNVVERMVIFCDGQELQEKHLPPEVRSPGSVPPVVPAPGQTVGPVPAVRAPSGGVMPLNEIEKQAIFEALDQTRGNKTQAARVLGIGVRTLHRKLKEYGYTDHNEA
jgi:two-component system, NtrC family, response regulator HydG